MVVISDQIPRVKGKRTTANASGTKEVRIARCALP